MKLPVMNGREVLGYATGERSASILIRKRLTVHPQGRLYVWRRQAHVAEILDLPDAYVFAIAYGPSR